jgi:hypothetical protein
MTSVSATTVKTTVIYPTIRTPGTTATIKTVISSAMIVAVITIDGTTIPSTFSPITMWTDPNSKVSIPVNYISSYIIIGSINCATTIVITKLYHSDGGRNGRITVVNAFGATCSAKSETNTSH